MMDDILDEFEEERYSESDTSSDEDWADEEHNTFHGEHKWRA